MSSHKILIVEDEQAIADMIAMALEMAGFVCQHALDGKTALSLLHDFSPDLILLDWMLPSMTGIEFLQRIKRDDVSRDIPVIMLTAKTLEDNKIQGLETGADDYITKPFAPKEMVARIKAVLRRSAKISQQDLLKAGDIVVDHASHRVSLAGKPADVGPTEYKLLCFFISNQDRVYSRSQLLDHVWGHSVYVEERTVDVHIRRLRKALALPDEQIDLGHYVQTIRGRGYRFSVADK